MEGIIVLLKSCNMSNIWWSREINNLLLWLIKIRIFLFNRSDLLFQSRNNNRRGIAGHHNNCIHQCRLSYRRDWSPHNDTRWWYRASIRHSSRESLWLEIFISRENNLNQEKNKNGIKYTWNFWLKINNFSFEKTKQNVTFVSYCAMDRVEVDSREELD